MAYRAQKCLMGFVLSVLAGCGGSQGIKTVDVSGTVFLDGKPLPGVAVNFVGPTYAGFAKTGENGQYQLNAQPGENKLFFFLEGSAEKGEDVGQLEAAAAGSEAGRVTAPAGPGPAIPDKYTDAATSGITFNVPENGASGADFKLTSKP